MLETQQLPIQTLIMCTTGIGTSELLKAKIIKKFPDLNIVDVIATKNYRTALEKNPNIELILTTVGIRSRLGVHTLLVSAMLTADDQSRIQKKIGEIYNERWVHRKNRSIRYFSTRGISLVSKFTLPWRRRENKHIDGSFSYA